MASISDFAQEEQDALCINTIRMLAVDMVEKAAWGHPGMPMGAGTHGLCALESLSAP